MAEAEYGPIEDWYFDKNRFTYEDGTPVPGSSVAEQWFIKYFGDYLPIIAVEYDENKAYRAGSLGERVVVELYPAYVLAEQQTYAYEQYQRRDLEFFGQSADEHAQQYDHADEQQHEHIVHGSHLPCYSSYPSRILYHELRGFASERAHAFCPAPAKNRRIY